MNVRFKSGCPLAVGVFVCPRHPATGFGDLARRGSPRVGGTASSASSSHVQPKPRRSGRIRCSDGKDISMTNSLNLDPAQLDQLAINTIRFLSVDAVEKANSGHPGLPMGAAPMAYVLWTRLLRHNPANPRWFNRDRFVLSAGHGRCYFTACCI